MADFSDADELGALGQGGPFDIADGDEAIDEEPYDEDDVDAWDDDAEAIELDGEDR